MKCVLSRLQELELKVALQAAEIELLKDGEAKMKKEQHLQGKKSESLELQIAQLETRLVGSVKMEKAIVESIAQLSVNL